MLKELIGILVMTLVGEFAAASVLAMFLVAGLAMPSGSAATLVEVHTL